MLKKILQFIVFLGLGLGIMALVFRSQNAAFQEQCNLDGIAPEQCSLMDKLWNDFSSINLVWMLLVVLAFTVSNICRALRWQMLLAPMGHRVHFFNSFLPILVGYFANLGFPRIGEVVRAGTLARYENVPMEKVMGTLVVDRLVDFLCLGLVVGLAFIFEGQTLLDFISQNKSGTNKSILQNPFLWAFLGVAAVGCLLVYLFWAKIQQIPIVQKIAGLLIGFWEGLRSVFKLKNPGLFIAYSLGIWLMFYLQCYFNLQAFPPTRHLGVSAALMVFVFSTLGFVIPSPGGMGSFHALAIAGLAIYGIAGSDGFSYANIAFFTIQILYNLVAGVLSLILLPLLNRK